MKVYCKDCKYLREENFESNVGHWCVICTIDRFPNFELMITCLNYKPKWWVRILNKLGGKG